MTTIEMPTGFEPSPELTPRLMTLERAAALRKPFPPEAIGKLPRAGVELDYVGHAQVCDRLLSVDPLWSWEPVAWTDDGLPRWTVRGKDAVMWIRLTVCSVTRLGVGIVNASAFELEKQLISDALRNAAMRFGVALDLWAKQPLEGEIPALVDDDLRDEIRAGIEAHDDPPAVKAAWANAGLPRLDRLTVDRLPEALALLNDHDVVLPGE